MVKSSFIIIVKEVYLLFLIKTAQSKDALSCSNITIHSGKERSLSVRDQDHR